jgi:hypothetical protein
MQIKITLIVTSIHLLKIITWNEKMLQRKYKFSYEKQTYLFQVVTHHFFQCSTSPKRTSEVCEAVNKGGEKFTGNGS